VLLRKTPFTMKVLVPVADASEDIELACITDTLVRAGAEVVVASVMEEGRLQVKLARGLKLVADVHIDDCKDQEWAAIAMPGGMPGAQTLSCSEALESLLRKQRGDKKLIAAVCASPAVVLAKHALLPPSATCYPAPKFKEALAASSPCTGWGEAVVVSDDNVITSQGPGTSLQFALKIVEVLFGTEKASELAGALLTTTA